MMMASYRVVIVSLCRQQLHPDDFCWHPRLDPPVGASPVRVMDRPLDIVRRGADLVAEEPCRLTPDVRAGRCREALPPVRPERPAVALLPGNEQESWMPEDKGAGKRMQIASFVVGFCGPKGDPRCATTACSVCWLCWR
jgi:hypothetical protein